MNEGEIDARVQEILSMEPEDPQTVFNIRESQSTKGQTKFQVFWDEAAKYVEEDIGTAVDDRKHDTVTHLAKAVSSRDFHEQVVQKDENELAIHRETEGQVHGTTMAVQKITPR